jgi:hypothetical protein
MNMVNIERCFNLLDDIGEYWFDYTAYWSEKLLWRTNWFIW